MSYSSDNDYQDSLDSTASDWEVDDSEEVEFVPDDTVELPVGIRKDGQVYRTVVIDELGGVDDRLVADSKVRGNGAKAMSLVICRSVQEVPGLLKQKQNPDKMFNREFARAMTEIDRVFLITRIFMLSGRNESAFVGTCRHCKTVHYEKVYLSNLKVDKWPDDKPPEIEFRLKGGFKERKDNGEYIYHRDGVLSFPTGKTSELIGKITNEAEALDSMLASCIKNVGTYGRVDSSMAQALKKTDREELLYSLSDGLPGIKQGKWITCECGVDLELSLDLVSFFDGRRRRARKP
jgi:hypothetical protein